MNELQNYLYNYASKNWKFTPKSKRVLTGAAGILLAGIIAANIINKKNEYLFFCGRSINKI